MPSTPRCRWTSHIPFQAEPWKCRCSDLGACVTGTSAQAGQRRPGAWGFPRVGLAAWAQEGSGLPAENSSHMAREGGVRGFPSEPHHLSYGASPEPHPTPRPSLQAVEGHARTGGTELRAGCFHSGPLGSPEMSLKWGPRSSHFTGLHSRPHDHHLWLWQTRAGGRRPPTAARWPRPSAAAPASQASSRAQR